MENKEDAEHKWESCCFTLDQRCVVFTVQTCLGMALITFCAYMLSTETNCDRAAPYWGLIGTIAGFFFNRLSVTNYNGEHNSIHTQQPHNQRMRSPMPHRVPLAVPAEEVMM